MLCDFGTGPRVSGRWLVRVGVSAELTKWTAGRHRVKGSMLSARSEHVIGRVVYVMSQPVVRVEVELRTFQHGIYCVCVSAGAGVKKAATVPEACGVLSPSRQDARTRPNSH